MSKVDKFKHIDADQKLNKKQELFCEFYITHFNATRACREAGYGEDKEDYAFSVMGHENLSKPHVKRRINELCKATALSSDELKQLMLSRMSGTNTEKIITITETKDANGKIINISERITKQDKETPSSRNKLIEMYGKMGGHFEVDNMQQQTSVTVNNLDITKLSDSALQEILAAQNTDTDLGES